jgi:NAD(P)-dependent dehydrogenase (short-subunit alcohol dehydrogenase family)
MARWTAADIPDQAGRTAVVTGSNSGLGLVAARELARHGCSVVLAVRDTAKGSDAVSTFPDGGSARVEKLDLADLASVREFAQRLADEQDRLDLLINNAGIMAAPRRLTVDGFESHLGVNHLGHFALTGLLLELLSAAAAPRVVTLSSGMHRAGTIKFDDLQRERGYNNWLAYGQSKLANLMFTSELQRRLEAAGSSLRALAAHPGYSHTNLQGQTGRKFGDTAMSFATRLFASDADFGARQTLYAASQDLPGNSFIGASFGMAGRSRPVGRSPLAKRAATANALWELSERLTETKFPL